MKPLKDFTNSAISMIKKNADEFGKMMKDLDFDFSSAEKKFNELESSLKDQFAELKKRVKDLTDKFIVEIPFDRENETLSFKIENGKIIVTTERHTENRDAKSVTETIIPTGIDVNRMIQRYDEKDKKMRFIFFKTVGDVYQKKGGYQVSEEISDETVTETKTEDKVAEKEALIRKMIEMHEKGFSYRKIAEETGISDKTVKRWIKSALRTD